MPWVGLQYVYVVLWYFLSILTVSVAYAAVRSKDGGSVVVDSLVIVAVIVCRGFVFGPYFVMQNLVCFLILQSS